ncbi:uncharacterized protein IL334_007609 [Kwoniella shivajii]|uniref:Zn(2)-C6 fungal-type domain-containing protein n=1 Tax=Kwoniella shivajii TaxID=564305 RepID=A0ABZ1DCA1_9TREE|nr:hypothetical protein IL334_007609 [Kwoniella shivajii]
MPVSASPRLDERVRPSPLITSSGPSQGRVACKRCFMRKRKCDKLQPRCTACVEADVECEAGIKAVERSLVMQTQELQKRIEWLESLLQHGQPPLGNISSLATGSLNPAQRLPMRSNNSQLSQNDFTLATLVSASLSMQRAENMPDQGYVESIPSSAAFGSGSRSVELELDLSMTSASQHPVLPSMDRALDIMNSFLARHLQSHHSITKKGIEEDIRLVYGENGMVARDLAGSRFRSFSVIFLETSPAYHGGDQTFEKEFGSLCRNLALKEIPNVISKEDLTTVQALALLCVYGVDIPGGPSLSQIVGFAARAAMAINIHRKDDIYLAPLLGPSQDKSDFKEHNELRKNIFWAIYCLDRLAAFTLGQPVSIRDSDVDVELPADPAQPSSNMSVEVSGVALRCHQIHLRRLYGIVRETFYSSAVNPNRPQEEKEAIVADFVCQAQGWYNQSPLKAAFAPMTEATISRQVVDDISYHQMIMAAHRPSPLIPEIPSSFVTTLKYSATLSIELYRHYCKSKKVLIIWTHLYQIFMSCTTLIFCFAEHLSRPDLVEVPKDEVEWRIEQCKDLLARFGTAWPESSRYRTMFDNLVRSFKAQIITGSTSAVASERVNVNNIVFGHHQSSDISNGPPNEDQRQLSQITQMLSSNPQNQEDDDQQRQQQSIQTEVSLFDLFGNFPMMETNSEMNSSEQLFNSMVPAWEYSPGSLESMNSVMI